MTSAAKSVLILSLLSKTVMNQVLGSVSNLVIVVHLMLMPILYPPIVIVFYSYIFEFIRFDLGSGLCLRIRMIILVGQDD